jgi:inosine/xanthosine triphosphate pyrophosphatase family protein
VEPATGRVLLATTNRAKQARLQWLLEGLPLVCHSPGEAGLGVYIPPEETGASHCEIAAEKAVGWSQAGSMLAVCSDGGLNIPALGDRWQSILTRRLTGEGSDEERVERLLELMRPYPPEHRQASWTEALAIADNGRLLACWEVQGATGMVALTPGPQASVSGFWAFTVWEIPALGKRYSELTEDELASVDDHWTQLKWLAQPLLVENLKAGPKGGR